MIKMPSKNNRNGLMDCLMNRSVVVSVLVAVFVLVSLASPAIAQASSDAVLILHFDEGSGTIAKDESGHGNDGTIYGATWTTGISGKALEFDGMNDYIEIPDSNSIEPQRLSISVWIKPNIDQDTIDYALPILSKTNSDRWYVADGYDLTYSSSGIGIGLAKHSAWRKGFGVEKNLPAHSWSHIVATYDEQTMRLYLDGQLIGSKSESFPIHYGSENLWIGKFYQKGKDNKKGNYFFNGAIDEVAIYSKALTAEEIKAHYLAKRAGSPTTALSLTKTASPYSIKQDQKTTVKITVENTGTTTIKDREVVDTPPADFEFVSGDTSAKYGILKPRESRTFQYTLRSGDTGKFDLGQATATYADEEGNYHTVKSNSPLVEVMSPLEKPEIPTGEEGEKKGIPGFGAAFAIAGLLAVAYLIRRRKVK